LSTVQEKYGLSNKTIQRISTVFKGFPEINRVVLYGSRAIGNFSEGSDIDICIFGDAIQNGTKAKIANALDDLLLPYKIDLQIFSEIDNNELLDHIRRVGKEIYTRV
jgi:predicted nucleotidyltransferase